mgnify:CR=1 FL=1
MWCRKFSREFGGGIFNMLFLAPYYTFFRKLPFAPPPKCFFSSHLCLCRLAYMLFWTLIVYLFSTFESECMIKTFPFISLGDSNYKSVGWKMTTLLQVHCSHYGLWEKIEDKKSKLPFSNVLVKRWK